MDDWDTRCDVLWRLDPHKDDPQHDRPVVTDIPCALAEWLVLIWNVPTAGRYYTHRRS